MQRLVVENTVQDRILALQDRKQLLADGSLGEGQGKKLRRLSVRGLPVSLVWTIADASLIQRIELFPHALATISRFLLRAILCTRRIILSDALCTFLQPFLLLRSI